MMYGDKLKTSMFGGFNKRDVLKCVEEITDTYETKNKEIEDEMTRNFNEMKSRLEGELSKKTAEYEKLLKEQKTEFEQKLEQLDTESKEKLKAQKLYYENKIEKHRQETEDRVSEVTDGFDSEKEEIRKKFEEQVLKFKAHHEEQTNIWENIRKGNLKLSSELESLAEAYEQKKSQTDSLKQINRDLEIQNRSLAENLKKHENIVGDINAYELKKKSEADRRSEAVIAESERILTDAKNEANSLLGQAKADAEKITSQSYEKSLAVVNEAKHKASVIMSDAELNLQKISNKIAYTVRTASDELDILHINLDEIKNNLNNELLRATASIEAINSMVSNAKTGITAQNQDNSDNSNSIEEENNSENGAFDELNDIINGQKDEEHEEYENIKDMNELEINNLNYNSNSTEKYDTQEDNFFR